MEHRSTDYGAAAPPSKRLWYVTNDDTPVAELPVSRFMEYMVSAVARGVLVAGLVMLVVGFFLALVLGSL